MTNRTAGRSAAIICALLVSGTAQARPRPPHLLFFTRQVHHPHAAVTGKDGQPSVAGKVMEQLAADNGFRVTQSTDGRLFTPEGLAPFDGFIFYTIGDPTTAVAADGSPPMPPEGKQLLLDSVAKGKPFIGIHVASDTFLTPGNPFSDAGDQADPYVKMLGGEFIPHGAQQQGRAFCADPRWPGMSPGFCDTKDGVSLFEEWYSLKNYAKDIHVIMWLATWSLKNVGKDACYRRAPYPIAWSRLHGKGRVFYTALGHRDEVWASPAFRSMLAGGIKWATGAVKASIKPNLTAVTPYYYEIPPDERPPPKDAKAPGAKAPGP
jgi:hypothetical protein